jgi:hypothetical protein
MQTTTINLEEIVRSELRTRRYDLLDRITRWERRIFLIDRRNQRGDDNAFEYRRATAVERIEELSEELAEVESILDSKIEITVR